MLNKHDDDEDFWTALCSRKRRKHRAAQIDHDEERKRRSGWEATAEPTPRFVLWDPCDTSCLPTPTRRRATPHTRRTTIL